MQMHSISSYFKDLTEPIVLHQINEQIEDSISIYFFRWQLSSSRYDHFYMVYQ